MGSGFGYLCYRVTFYMAENVCGSVASGNCQLQKSNFVLVLTLRKKFRIIGHCYVPEILLKEI